LKPVILPIWLILTVSRFQTTYEELKLQKDTTAWVGSRFQTTYEELKPSQSSWPDFLSSFQTTYEELKLAKAEIFSVVTARFQTTYEELKPHPKSFIHEQPGLPDYL